MIFNWSQADNLCISCYQFELDETLKRTYIPFARLGYNTFSGSA